MPTNSSLATKDPSILLRRIEQIFPELRWDKYIFIDTGWDHEVIKLDNKYIFRFPNSSEYLAALRDEIELLAYLGSRLNSYIPSYLYVAPDFSFGGYEMLTGNDLGLDLFHSLSEAQQAKVAEALANFLSDLHSIDTSELQHFHVGTESDFAGYGDVAAEAEKYLKPNLSEHEYQLICNMLDEIKPAQQYSQPARLIHGDIAPKHLIWDADAETLGFIDFSDRSISDPAYDFAELYAYGETFVDKIYSLYTGPDKSEKFLSRAKAYMKAIGIHSFVNTYRTDKMQRDEAIRLLEIGAALHIKYSP